MADFEKFEKMGAQVLTISTDSVFVHKMWDENELKKVTERETPFPMLSDASGEIGKEYNVYSEDNKFDTRGTFIIDPDGIVKSMEILSPGTGRNFDETLRQLAAHQEVRKSNGAEAMPTNWKPGEPVLKPRPELVGNIWKEWKVKK